MTLGRYDSKEAVETLPAQLALLRTFADLRRPDAGLLYRLETVIEPEGGVGAHFAVLCVGRTKKALTSAEAQSLADQISVTFLPAWPLVTWSRYARTRPPRPSAAAWLRCKWAAIISMS